MTKQELEQKIEALQKQLDELKKVKVEEPKKKWIPEENELYYFVSDNLEIYNADNTNRSFFDIPRFEIGNCFETKQEAQFVADKIKYTLRFKHYVEEHSEPIDWNDKEQKKWYIYCICCTSEIVFAYDCNCKSQGTIYASSEEILQDAINYIGEDNVKKYILEVE